MMKRTSIALLFVILFLIGCNAAAVEEATPEEPTVTEAEVEETAAEEEEPVVQEEGPRAVTILADGEVRAVNPTLVLAFETSGKLGDLNIQAGDTIEAGDVIATLDTDTLQDSVTSAELRVAQAENSLAQAQKQLDDLLTWEPDEGAIAIAEANITSAQANLENAQSQDAVAGNGLVAARVNIDQAQRELDNAQEQYDNAFSPGREWEVGYNDYICAPGQLPPCSGITYAERIENDREIATTRLQVAKEQLQIAQANFQTELSRSSSNSAVGAEASLVAAEQELVRALTGPTEEEIESAELNLTSAQLSLEDAQFALNQAQEALDQAQLIAPWSGTILTIDAAPGALISPGTPIATVLDAVALEFYTTNLSERDLAQIEPGQSAVVTLKTYPNDPVEGTVVRIGTQAVGVVADAAVFPVIIEIPSDALDIRPGMTGRAEILTE